MELKIPPVIVVFIFGGTMWLISYNLHFDWATFNSSPLITAAILVVAGLVSVLGLIQFFKHATSIDPHKPDKASTLVTGGVYRFSRNPMYTGLLLILVAYGFYLGNFLAFLLLPLFVGYMNRYQIKPEEKVMEQKFGDRYLRYKSSVRRWL